MSGPSIATIKRLFAVSKNLCSFPNCTMMLVDNASGKVTGKICHIKARQPGGPRYDSNQTEKQRHGYNNLILMCPIHHDVIDSDIDSYTVERLQQLKAQHEELQEKGNEPSDEIANQLLLNITSTTIPHGSIILNQDQMGGQVAHSITNIGQQPRRISKAAANALITELLKFPPETVQISTLMNDSESYNLANILEGILKSAGWELGDLRLAHFSKQPRGVVVQAPAEKSSLNVFLNWMSLTGLKPQGIIVPVLDRAEIIVGSNT
jgi:hypothetical protein